MDNLSYYIGGQNACQAKITHFYPYSFETFQPSELFHLCG